MTDTRQRTTNSRVWAAGDMTGRLQFVYGVGAQVQLASAGCTEVQASANGDRGESRVVQLDQVLRAVVNRDTRGAVKVVIDTDRRRVLGAHAVAAGPGDLMGAPYLTMSEALGLTAQSFRTDITQLSCCAA